MFVLIGNSWFPRIECNGKHLNISLWNIALNAKSLQSCPTLCDPIDGSPPGSPDPGILQARTLEWVAISFSSAWKWEVKVKSLSRVRLLATPWTAAHQAPPSMGFSSQEYWSGVPLKYSTHMCKYNKYIWLKNNYEVNTCVPTTQLRHWDVTNTYEVLFLPDCTLFLTTDLVLVFPSGDNHYHDFLWLVSPYL